MKYGQRVGMPANKVLELFSDLLVGLAASSLWALAGYVLFASERRRNRRLAAFMLVPTLDRIRDILGELIAELPGIEAGPRTQTRLLQIETRLLRTVEQTNVEWVLSHLPKATDGVPWALDLTFVYGNAREVANEILSLRESIGAKEPKHERLHHYESLTEVSTDLISTISEQIQRARTLAPDMFPES